MNIYSLINLHVWIGWAVTNVAFKIYIYLEIW